MRPPSLRGRECCPVGHSFSRRHLVPVDTRSWRQSQFHRFPPAARSDGGKNTGPVMAGRACALAPTVAGDWLTRTRTPPGRGRWCPRQPGRTRIPVASRVAASVRYWGGLMPRTSGIAVLAPRHTYIYRGRRGARHCALSHRQGNPAGGYTGSTRRPERDRSSRTNSAGECAAT